MKAKAKQMLQSLQYLHSLSNRLLPLIVLTKLLYTLIPFVNIVLSSMIIDKLVSKADLQELILLTGITVSSNVILNLAAHGINQIMLVHLFGFSRMYNIQIALKTADMDFELIENPETHKLKAKIEDSQNASSWWSLTNVFEKIVESAFGILFAIIVGGKLFASGSTKALVNTPWFTLLYLVLLLSSIFLTFFVDKKFLTKIYKVLDEFSGGNRIFLYLNNLIATYKNGKDIRIYNAKALLEQESENLWGKVGFVGFKKLSHLDGSLKGLKGGITAATGGLIYLFVAMKAVLGELSVGQIVRYANSISQFITHFSGLINSLNTFSLNCSRMQNTFDYLNLPDKMHKGTLPVEKRNDYEYELVFHKVSFRYPGATEYVLKDLNLKLHIGQRMAVVGMNGSGKTTMIKLLCRLYDPTEGMITLNNIDIRKYDYAEYMSLFGVVFQDFKLFSFTLGQNVATSLSYERDRATDALHKAGLDARLANLPQGLDTPLYKGFVEDGIEISGGEAQKVALARALYKDAPFIVLDEPTAALDPIAEFEIYSNFNKIVGERTVIYISHRLSSCRFCHEIAVFNEGRLVQRGSHDTLIQDRSGKYYELWNAQAQYYTDKTS